MSFQSFLEKRQILFIFYGEVGLFRVLLSKTGVRVCVCVWGGEVTGIFLMGVCLWG